MKHFPVKFLFTFGIVLLLSQVILAKEKPLFIAAKNSGFSYIGRVAINNGTATYNWPGVTVTTKFSGNMLGIALKGGTKNYFNIRIDNQKAQVIHPVNDTIWWYPGQLSSGEHKLCIIKRTEGEMGMVEFRGIYIEEGRKIEKVTLPTKKILFIGNSITCGYGDEGKSKTDHFKPSTENCEKSYALIVSRAFNTQYQLISHSGLGMVRNYGDKDKLSVTRKTMPKRITYLFDEDSVHQYNLQNYIPDAIVINLGTNDYSTLPHPDSAVFVSTGIKLINRLLNAYPKAKIFCITGPMIDEPCFSNTEKMVKSVDAARNTDQVYFIGLPRNLLNQPGDFGADSHPSYRGHIKSAEIILPIMGKAMKWHYSSHEIRKYLSSK